VAPDQQHFDPLQPVLRDAEAELQRRLHEACEAEAKGVASESAAEIRQLEDALLAAAVAAEHTLTLRRHIQQKEREVTPPATKEADSGAKASAPEAPPAKSTPLASTGSTTGTLREFTDRRGNNWRAWPVTPDTSRASRTKHFLGDFQVGWICFEGLDDAARRRLAGHPERWNELTEDELEALLERAMTVRERRPRSTDAKAAPPAG
jgi:hypothetical protein